MKYDKEPLKYDEQLQLLEERGLLVKNRAKVINTLKEINYYRLSAYFYTFLEDKANHVYKPNTTFNKVIKLYQFDSRLRQILLPALESAEILVRLRMTYYLVHITNDPFHYLQEEVYSAKFLGKQIAIEELERDFSKEKSDLLWNDLKRSGVINSKGRILKKSPLPQTLCAEDQDKVEKILSHSSYILFLQEVEHSICNSHEEFVRHYKNKYLSDSLGFPLWMITEMLSFGNLSRMFTGLDTQHRNAISTEYGLPHRIISSWLHSLVYLRNICAHHARLWNRAFVIAPSCPKKLPENACWSKRLFSMLLVLKYMVPDSFNWKEFVKDIHILLRKNSFIDISAMGFPRNWKRVLLDNKFKSERLV